MPQAPQFIDRHDWFSIDRAFGDLTRVVNGNVGFGNGIDSDNINGKWLIDTIPSASIDFTLTHNLGRIPVGYLLVDMSAPTIIYRGSIAWTDTTITLKATAISDIKLFVF